MFINTPFFLAMTDRFLNIAAFTIGSGECHRLVAA